MAAAIDELAKECVQSQDAASTATLLDVLEKAGIAKRFRIHPEYAVAEMLENCFKVTTLCVVLL